MADPKPYPVTLLLGPITTSHLYRDDHIVYSSRGSDMGTYEYHRWAEPPTEMIEDVLLRELRTSGRYRTVDSRGSNVRGDYLLYGRLYDLEEVSRGTIVGRVTVELELRDTKSGRTVWTHYYTHDEPVTGKDISGVVAALDRNVQRCVSEFSASLEGYFSTYSPSNSIGAQ